MPKNSKHNERTAVKPFHGERVDMALQCRHGLTSTDRFVLVALADRCWKDQPNQVMKLSIDYFAQMTGLGSRSVHRSLAKLKKLELISRRIDYRYDEPRLTYMNWPLIAQEKFTYVPVERKSTKDQSGDDLVVFPIGDQWSEEFQEPTEQAADEAVPEPSEVVHEDMSGLDLVAPEPKVTEPAQIDPELQAFLERDIDTIKEQLGAGYYSRESFPESFDLDVAREFLKPHGLLIDVLADGSYLIAMPLHEAAAMLTNKATGKQWHPSQFMPLHKIKVEDPYATLYWAFEDDSSWINLLKKADSPGLLVSLFARIEESAKVTEIEPYPDTTAQEDEEDTRAEVEAEMAAA
ncbi:MAG TPA: hypothetical protein VGM02_01640 [Acidobacteriaceae bacterium]|jgi:predicted transcriptional regulator